MSTRRNLLFIDADSHATLAIVDAERDRHTSREHIYSVSVVTTRRLQPQRYVRLSDDRQICDGAAFRGPTVSYYNPEQLARDLGARLFKTEAGFKRALTRARQAADA